MQKLFAVVMLFGCGAAQGALVGTTVRLEHQFGAIEDYRIDGEADVLVTAGPGDTVDLLQGTMGANFVTIYTVDVEDDFLIIDFSSCARISIYDCNISFNGANDPDRHNVNGLFVSIEDLGLRGYSIADVSSDSWQLSDRLYFGNDWVFVEMGGLGANRNTVWTLSMSIVPIPAAVWLFASALGLLGWVRHKQ